MRLFLGSFATINDYGAIKQRFSFIEGKWVEKKNLHLTFLFLGEVATPAFIIEALKSIHYPHITIPIESLGFFGSPPRVLYAKANDEELFRLHSHICQALGKEPTKPFLPHITLCRIKRAHPFGRFIEALRSYQNRPIGSLKLQLQLIQSHLTPKGPIYRPIHTF